MATPTTCAKCKSAICYNIRENRFITKLAIAIHNHYYNRLTGKHIHALLTLYEKEYEGYSFPSNSYAYKPITIGNLPDVCIFDACSQTIFDHVGYKLTIYDLACNDKFDIIDDAFVIFPTVVGWSRVDMRKHIAFYNMDPLKYLCAQITDAEWVNVVTAKQIDGLTTIAEQRFVFQDGPYKNCEYLYPAHAFELSGFQYKIIAVAAQLFC